MAEITPSEMQEALRLAREMVEEIPAEELPISGLLLLSRALLVCNEERETQRDTTQKWYDEAHVRIRELEAALRDALDVAIWLSALVGNPDGANDPAAAETWEKEMRPKLFAALDPKEEG